MLYNYSYKLHLSVLGYSGKVLRGLVTVSNCLEGKHPLSLAELIIEPIIITQTQKESIRSQLKTYTINYLKDRPILSLKYKLRQGIKIWENTISQEQSVIFSWEGSKCIARKIPCLKFLGKYTPAYNLLINLSGNKPLLLNEAPSILKDTVF